MDNRLKNNHLQGKGSRGKDPQEKKPQGTHVKEDREVKIRPGELAELQVSAMTRIGAFLDIGEEKELLLPFAEQTRDLQPGDKVFVAEYIDKTGRPCSTMRVEPYLLSEAPYHKGDIVKGTVYEASAMGLFVAVADKYFGLIPSSETEGRDTLGPVEARVVRVRPDGKLDLSLRGNLEERMSDEAAELFRILERAGGKVSVGDHSSPEEVKAVTGMSKKAFKRAVGHLLKEKKIRITESGIEAFLPGTTASVQVKKNPHHKKPDRGSVK